MPINTQQFSGLQQKENEKSDVINPVYKGTDNGVLLEETKLLLSV